MMQLQLEGSSAAPRRARQFVQEHWQSMVADVATTQADVALVASELVTNAVEAGARRITVQIRATTTRVELSVSDDAGGWPMEQHPDPRDARGRGLLITTRLTDRWTATQDATGKTVTATWSRTPFDH